MKITKALLIATVVFANAVHAAKWELVSKSARAEVFVDINIVTSAQGEPTVVVRRNLLADAKRKRSQLLKYKVNCDDSTLTLVDAYLFEGLDLSGNVVKVRFDRMNLTFVPETNMLGSLYVNKGCESQETFPDAKTGKNFFHVAHLSPSSLMDKMIRPVWKIQDIESFRFNYSFLFRLREKMRIPPQGKNASVELPYYQYLLTYKDKIDQSFLMMDAILAEIAGRLGVEKTIVESAFEIVPYVSEGSFYLRENGTGAGGIFEGRQKADSFWYENSGIVRAKNNAGAASDPEKLFNTVYPGLIQRYRSEVEPIYSKAIEYERKEARSLKLRLDRERWLLTPEGKHYQLAQEQVARAQEEERVGKSNLDARKLTKEFPFVAIFSCDAYPKPANLMACFGESVATELELTNGNSQGIFKLRDIAALGKETQNGLEINLSSKFALKLQNMDDRLTVGVKIVDRSSHETFYQKQVARFGLISIRNTGVK